MADPRQLAVEALENAGWDADKARQIVADQEAAGIVKFAVPMDGELHAGHIAKLIDGATVSVDMSTGDDTAFDRIFGRAYSAQREGDGSLTILAEFTEDNRTAPVDGELREALALAAGDVIWRIHGPESTDRESAEADGCDIADALMPRIAAHVAERERARELPSEIVIENIEGESAEDFLSKHDAAKELKLREEIYADIRAQWRCPHDDPKEQAECYWQNHGEEIIRDLETAREERGAKQ